MGPLGPEAARAIDSCISNVLYFFPEGMMRPAGSPQELERRRFRALSLLRDGVPPVEVARRVGVDRRSVRRWNAAARRRGEAAVRAKPAPGRPSKLTARHKRRLETL